MVHAGDVAQAVVAALARPKSHHKAYNVTGESVGLVNVFRLLRELEQRDCRILRIPLGLGQHFNNDAAYADLALSYRSLRDGWMEVLHSDDT